MDEPILRIFSYLPNPRVWKSLIAADYCSVNVEVVGDKPNQLSNWLWDYSARRMDENELDSNNPHARASRRGFSGTLYKTDEFLMCHPFGTVPAAFSPGGEVGVFESNSILRAVARAGAHNRQLYGRDIYEASRIDSYLDANLVFAREAQVYLLAMEKITVETHGRMASAYEFYLSGIEQSLSNGNFLVGESISIADISFVCDFAQFLREGHYTGQLEAKGLPLISRDGLEEYPRAFKHMLDLCKQEFFVNHLGTYLNWYQRKNTGALNDG
jgi:elongation factor 1-gamma